MVVEGQVQQAKVDGKVVKISKNYLKVYAKYSKTIPISNLFLLEKQLIIKILKKHGLII